MSSPMAEYDRREETHDVLLCWEPIELEGLPARHLARCCLGCRLPAYMLRLKECGQ